jgi:hypothetical protein
MEKAMGMEVMIATILISDAIAHRQKIHDCNISDNKNLDYDNCKENNTYTNE